MRSTATCAIVFAACFSTAHSSVVLYDVGFDSPVHTVGEAPSFGGSDFPRDTPTRFGFDHGTAIVVTSYADLTDQPLLLIPEAAEQRPSTRIDFDLLGADTYPRYILSVDMHLSSFEGALDVLSFYFNTPGSHQISLKYDGALFQRGDSLVIPNAFEFDTAFNFKVDVDLAANVWSIQINDESLYSGIFHKPFPASPDPPTRLEDISLILDFDQRTPNIPVAAIDNLKIEAIPEPSTSLFIISGFAFALTKVGRTIKGRSQHLPRREFNPP